MSADIVRRLIDSTEEANDDLGGKSFHHTVSSDSPPLDASSQIDQLTSANSQFTQTNGKALFASLTARAQHKAHLDETLGSNSPARSYQDSLVGSAGKDSDLRRQLTMRQRQERKAREERFRDTTGGDRRGKSSRDHRRTNRRQRFNADGSVDTTNDSPSYGNLQNRQESNASNETPRIVFREPPSRGYDPYSG